MKEDFFDSQTDLFIKLKQKKTKQNITPCNMMENKLLVDIWYKQEIANLLVKSYCIIDPHEKHNCPTPKRNLFSL